MEFTKEQLELLSKEDLIRIVEVLQLIRQSYETMYRTIVFANGEMKKIESNRLA